MGYCQSTLREQFYTLASTRNLYIAKQSASYIQYRWSLTRLAGAFRAITARLNFVRE
jgi:hypothetical protein